MWMHDDYLDRLEADATARARVAMAEEYLRDTVRGITFDAMFIGNGGVAPEEQGPRFGGLWYFTDTYRITVAQFLTQPMYQLARNGPIEGINILSQYWEINDPNPESRMIVQFIDPFSNAGSMAALGANCTQLQEVVKGFLLPRIRLA